MKGEGRPEGRPETPAKKSTDRVPPPQEVAAEARPPLYADPAAEAAFRDYLAGLRRRAMAARRLPALEGRHHGGDDLAQRDPWLSAVDRAA